MDCRTEGDSNIDTEGEGNGELGINDEIELVFKPHPTEMSADNQLIRALKENCVRYIKTTANATVDHLSKYLAMRLTLDLGADLPEACRLLNFCIYVAPQPQQLVILNGNQTLHQVNDKFWKVSRGSLYFNNPNLTNYTYNCLGQQANGNVLLVEENLSSTRGV